MTHATKRPNVAIRAALQRAGLLTETGEICGTEADRPDARLLALLARYDLAWTSYVASQRKRRKRPGEKAAADEYYAAAKAIAGAVATIQATSVEGARGKAQLVIEQTHGAGTADAVSALRDAVRDLAPTTVLPARRRRQEATQPDEGPLMALIAEYRDVRRQGRPDGLCGDGPTSGRMVVIKRFLVLQDRLTQTSAMTRPGIRAKLQATLPSSVAAHRCEPLRLLRSAMLDMLKLTNAGVTLRRSRQTPCEDS